MEEVGMNIQEYIDTHPGLSEERIVMLKYLEKAADKFYIAARPKGNSVAKLEFDCGAYKGTEFLEFKIKDLCPFNIAVRLMRLTSGHHFRYSEQEKMMIEYFRERVA